MKTKYGIISGSALSKNFQTYQFKGICLIKRQGCLFCIINYTIRGRILESERNDAVLIIKGDSFKDVLYIPKWLMYILKKFMKSERSDI